MRMVVISKMSSGGASVCVSTSGSLLSSLLFKLKNAPGDAEGFLLGKVCSHQVDNITDSQSRGRKEEKKICLHSFIHFNKKRSFYSGCSPEMSKVEDSLGDRLKDVVGWFSYRRNSSHRLSLIEKSLHHKLAQSFKHVQSKDFIVAVVTDGLVDGSAVYSTEYSFYSWDVSRFQSVSSEMLTLPSAMPYQLLPTRLLPPHLTHYNHILREQRAKFATAEGEVAQSKDVERLCAALLQKLEPLEAQVAATSREVEKAHKEVEELRKAVALAQQEASQEPSQEPSQEKTGLEDTAGIVPSSMSNTLLINIDHDVVATAEESLTVPPSLDILTGGMDMLVPERLSNQHETAHKLQHPPQQSQAQSQELF